MKQLRRQKKKGPSWYGQFIVTSQRTPGSIQLTCWADRIIKNLIFRYRLIFITLQTGFLLT